MSSGDMIQSEGEKWKIEEKHFQAPAEILRHIGSPFAPDKDQDAPLSLTQAA